MPLAALRLETGTVHKLATLGIETIAELEAMPRASLALRFGSEPGRRLDQVYSRLSEPLEPVEAPERIEGRLQVRVDRRVGFANLPLTFVELFNGRNAGTLLVDVSAD